MAKNMNNLSSLPDIDEAERKLEVLPTGETVMHRKTLPFVQYSVKSNDPFMFTDSEGSWFVIYGHEGGPHKKRI